MKTNSPPGRLCIVVFNVVLQLTLYCIVVAQNVDRIARREIERRQAALPRGVEAIARGQAAMQARNYRLAHDELRSNSTANRSRPRAVVLPLRELPAYKK